jgi:transposase-like protein
MKLKIGNKTGTGFGEKSPDRLAQRNGYGDRDWEMRAGTVELPILKLHKGRYVPAAGSKVLTARPGRAAAPTSCATPWIMPTAEDGASSGPSSPRLSTQCDAAASLRWRKVTDQLGPTVPKLAALMETDVLAYMILPTQHHAKLRSATEHDLDRQSWRIA